MCNDPKGIQDLQSKVKTHTCTTVHKINEKQFKWFCYFYSSNLHSRHLQHLKHHFSAEQNSSKRDAAHPISISPLTLKMTDYNVWKWKIQHWHRWESFGHHLPCEGDFKYTCTWLGKLVCNKVAITMHNLSLPYNVRSVKINK